METTVEKELRRCEVEYGPAKDILNAPKFKKTLTINYFNGPTVYEVENREHAEQVLRKFFRKNPASNEVQCLNSLSKFYKIMIIGDGGHGKGTVAKFLKKEHGFTSISSSKMALDLFLYDVLKEEKGLEYSTKKEAYEDRRNHRTLWYDEIRKYNKDDKTRLCKDILREYDGYDGSRDIEEFLEAKEQGLFDFTVGVFDPRKPREDKGSNKLDVFEHSDILIMNSGTLDDLRRTVSKIKVLRNEAEI